MPTLAPCCCAGLTLWSISKTYRLPQEGADQLLAALQVGAALLHSP